MKKKIIIPTILFIVIIIIGLIIWNNRVVSTITLDINPSIELGVNKHEKVTSIKALNNDAKEVINNAKGKTLKESISTIATNLKDKRYIDKEVVVLISSKGKTNNNIRTIIEESFLEKEIRPEIIIIENITKEDEELAKKYNITPAKAAYIKSIQNNIDIELLKDKSVKELKETKDTGLYCDKDYFLEGGWCYKEVSRKDAEEGKVCPGGYYEYKGICYEETGIEETDKLICNDDRTLKDNKCYKYESFNATPSKYECTKGEAKTKGELGITDKNAGNANETVCVDLSNATHPVTPCELPADDPTERMSYGGVCYWHRAPVIESGCPGKIQVAGECWDNASNILICAGYRDGRQYSSRNDYCEHSINYIEPTVAEYTCPDGFKLNKTKCEREEIEDPWHERICKEGYTKLENDTCINLNKTTSKTNGFVCTGDNTRLKGNTCITYEIIEAKKND